MIGSSYKTLNTQRDMKITPASLGLEPEQGEQGVEPVYRLGSRQRANAWQLHMKFSYSFFPAEACSVIGLINF